MALYLCNNRFQKTDIVEGFNSLTWTDRYTSAGDFQMKFSANDPTAKKLDTDLYLSMDGTNRHMVIENYVKDSNTNTITFSGRDLRALLERKSNWYALQKQANTKDPTRHGINTVARDLVQLSCIMQIDGFDNMVLGNDFLPWGATPSTQRDYSTSNVYDALATMCTEAEVGFEVEYMPEFTPNGGTKVFNKLVFYLRMGLDRSLKQTSRPQVVFDPSLDNIVDVSEVKQVGGAHTVFLKDEDASGGYVRMVHSTPPSDPYNAKLRNIIYTPTESDKNGFGGSDINVYRRYLTYKAVRAHRPIHVFDGKLLAEGPFTYNWDYALGDIVSIGVDPATTQRARISEYIWSYDENGFTEYPTFKVTETL